MSDETARTTREALLRTAERLYAEQGVTTVSNRTVAAEAGTANNSAVGYHFGGKTDLVLAIVRHRNEQTEPHRVRMLERTAGSTDPQDHIDSLNLPIVALLDELGAPTWYARFTLQVMVDPPWRDLVAEELSRSPHILEASRRLMETTRHLDPSLVRKRAQLAGLTVAHVCADHEADIHVRDRTPAWDGVGSFLSDALAGLILAPVRRRT